MNAGATFAQAHQLRPGIALSAAQVAQLTSDIVWLEARQVSLPDGSTTTALVPQVYLAPKAGDLASNGQLFAGGAVISANQVRMALSGDVNNSGTIAGRQLVDISARNIDNSGLIQGDKALLSAREDINITGGQVRGTSAAVATAGGNLNITSTVTQGGGAAGNGVFASQQIDRVAGIYVSGEAGVLLASAGGDINLTAAQVRNVGSGLTSLNSGGNVNLGTVKTGMSSDVTHDARNYARVQVGQEVGSTLSGGGSVAITATQNVNMRAAQVNAEGALSVSGVQGNVTVEAGQDSYSMATASHMKASGLLGSTTVTQRSNTQSTTAQASELGGRAVAISSGGDTRVNGSSVIADQDLSIHAGRDLSMEAAQNTHSDSSFSETKKSGLGAMGGISYGKSQQSQEQQSRQSTAAASTVGSVGGNVSLSAGQTYTQRGSDVLAPGGDISISAQRVVIEEARETTLSQSEQKAKQSGLSVSVGGGVIAAAQGLASTVQATGNTSSTRMQALGAATAALQARELAAQGQNLADLANAQSLTDVGKASGASISVSLGSSKSQSNNSQSSETARGSSVTAGGDVNITAKGAGANSDITVQGSDVKAGGTTRLKAEGDVQLLAAANMQSEANSQSSKSGSIGVSVAATGVSVNASASRGKGTGAGQSTSYTNSHVSGNTVLIESGGDTSLKGAVVQGDRVAAKVGGELTIESLQDSSRYQESSQSAGLSVSVPVTGANAGTGAGASVSAGKTRINSNDQSVGEQSGIRAGDGGFQVEVGGKTTLTGGAITSTDIAVQEGRNSFSTAGQTAAQALQSGALRISDLQNHADYEARGVNVGVGFSSSEAKDANGNTLHNPDGTPQTQTTPSRSVGYGQTDGQAGSTTVAAISGLAGNAGARTGEAQTGVQPIFNKDEVKQEVKAQIAITQEAGKRMPKLIAEEMGKKKGLFVKVG